MRIIDEKGRLFGKINVIDFLVVLSLFCIIPMFYFGYRLFNKQPVAIKKEMRQMIEIDLPFKLIKVPQDIVKLITLGDKEVDENGTVISEIIWLGESQPYIYKLDLGKGNIINEGDARLKEIPLRLKIKVEPRDSSLYYKGKQLIIDSPIEFKTAKYALSAIPIKDEKKVIEKMDLNVTLKNLTEEVIPLISRGDKELDKDGDVIAEILKIGKMGNDSREINLGSGNIIVGEDSNKRQLFTQMRLRCEINKDGGIYFKGKEVMYNSLLEFNFAKYVAQGKLASTLINEKWVEVKIKFSGVIPELAKVINEGDIEKDAMGRVAGRLKAIISNKPSESQVLVLEQNKFVTISQPFQKDIIIVLNLLCIEKDGILYYKNYPVRMGNLITFTTDIYSLQGLIIGLGDN